jgi:hypothetical protein
MKQILKKIIYYVLLWMLIILILAFIGYLQADGFN